MTKVSVKCPACGGNLTAMNKEDLAKAFKAHAHHEHDMDMSEEQARVHPLKNVVTRALGGESEVVVDVSEREIQAGDIYLLCSDGLTGMLEDKEIEAEALSGRPLDEVCVRLVELANARGGIDNVTVVAVAVEEAESDEAGGEA